MMLSNTFSVVTGASSGIGEATARALAGKGSRVLVVARRRERLEAIADDIQTAGGEAHAFPADLADADDLTRVATEITKAHGIPDILINNAGAGRWLSLEETSAADAAAMMAVPYLSAFNITRAFLPGMKTRARGHIVNVTSVAARLAWPGAVAYIAARRAMEGFSDALAADLSGTGIDVTLAIFGTVESSYWANNPGSRENLPKAGSGIRTLTTGEVAHAIVEAIEKRKRLVIRPRIYRALFLTQALFPERTARTMRG